MGICRKHTLSSDVEVIEYVRTPAVADWLNGVALRDLSMHERHAACIDASGDVYQWGDGFFSFSGSASTSGKPVSTLRGKVCFNTDSYSTLFQYTRFCRTSSACRPRLAESLLYRLLVTYMYCLQHRRSSCSPQVNLHHPARLGGELVGYGEKRRTSILHKSRQMSSWHGARGGCDYPSASTSTLNPNI